jgi:hypothetical protein
MKVQELRQLDFLVMKKIPNQQVSDILYVILVTLLLVINSPLDMDKRVYCQ